MEDIKIKIMNKEMRYKLNRLANIFYVMLNLLNVIKYKNQFS